MAKPQFASRQGHLICNECFGSSFTDPTKEFHWKDCSKYRAWRFGPPGGVVGVPSRSGEPRVTRSPEAQELIEDKVMDSVLEDYFRELPGGGE